MKGLKCLAYQSEQLNQPRATKESSLKDSAHLQAMRRLRVNDGIALVASKQWKWVGGPV
jgi:hypothetical protein